MLFASLHFTSLLAATDLQQTASYNEAKNILDRLEPLKEKPFKLVVTPDVFMTLDTLEEALTRPFLDQHPLSSILYFPAMNGYKYSWRKRKIAIIFRLDRGNARRRPATPLDGDAPPNPGDAGG